eukprot:SAG22_NODE_6700_length_821_cov_37.031856_1_plen_75_part_10
MECYNFTSYIDDIHGWCGNDLDNVITQCESLCLLSNATIPSRMEQGGLRGDSGGGGNSSTGTTGIAPGGHSESVR